jgi:hypothetical protein
MLFKILRLFGLDVPANIEAAKASLEWRVERAAVRAGQIARETAVIAVLFAAAMVMSAMAVGVGLLALYRWTADAYGDYAGLGVVGLMLVVAAAALIAVTAVKAKSLNPIEMRPRDVAGTSEAALDTPPSPMSLSPTSGTEPYAPETRTHSWTRPDTATLPAASASDLVEPLAFFLSKYVRVPTVGNPAVDELIGNLRATAHGSTDEAIDRAAEVIRHGNRSSMVFVLAGTAFLAWLLTQNSGR